MRASWLRPLLLALVAAVVTSTLAPAEAGRTDVVAMSPVPRWGPVVALSGEGDVGATVLATSAGDNRTVAAGWWRQSRRLGGQVGTLMVAVRMPGDGWGKPARVGFGEVRHVPNAPWLAVDGSGDVTVVYSFGNKVFTRTKPFGRAWSGRALVHRNPPFTTGPTPLAPAVWVNRAGAAMATWEWCDHSHVWTDNCFKWAAYRTAAGRWLPATRLEHEHRYAGAGVVTLDRQGRAMRYALVPDAHAVTVRSFEPGSGWSSPVELARRRTFLVAGDEAGRQVFLSGVPGQLWARVKRPGHSWSRSQLAVAHVFGATGDDRDVALAVGGGRATIAYRDRRTYGIGVVESRRDGSWSRSRLLNPDDRFVNQVGVAVDHTGHRVVAWGMAGDGTSPPIVRAATRAPGSGWGAATVVSPPTMVIFAGVMAAMRPPGLPVIGWRGRIDGEPRAWVVLRVRIALAPH